MDLLRSIAVRAFAELPVMGEGWKVPPSTLWHYADADAALSIIQRQELWATNALFMNDKSELRLIHDLFAEVLPKGHHSLTDDEWEEFANEFWRFLNDA